MSGLALLLWGSGVAVVLVVLFWSKLKTMWPFSLISGAAATTIGTVSDYATDAVTVAAEQTLATAGWVNGDLEYIQLVYACRKRRQTWNQPPATVTLAQPAVTLDAIAARLTNIEAKLPPTVQGP